MLFLISISPIWRKKSVGKSFLNFIPANWNWTDFSPEWTDPFQIRSSFLEKDLDPSKIQKKWSAIRIWNCCVQFLTMYDLELQSAIVSQGFSSILLLLVSFQCWSDHAGALLSGHFLFLRPSVLRGDGDLGPKSPQALRPRQVVQLRRLLTQIRSQRFHM